MAGADGRVFDAVDKLVIARNDSGAALGERAHVVLDEAGSNGFFEIRSGKFPASSPFERLEVRKPRNPLLHKGLTLLDVRTTQCVSPHAADVRYGPFDDLSPPLAGGPPNRPVYRTYNRPWGKLSFGFVETESGECLSAAVIDWAE